MDKPSAISTRINAMENAELTYAAQPVQVGRRHHSLGEPRQSNRLVDGVPDHVPRHHHVSLQSFRAIKIVLIKSLLRGHVKTQKSTGKRKLSPATRNETRCECMEKDNRMTNKTAQHRQQKQPSATFLPRLKLSCELILVSKCSPKFLLLMQIFKLEVT
jgi:hypothetical protein